MEYGLLIGGWIAYFVLHSLLAANLVKQVAGRWLGKGFRYYRLGYAILSTAGLIALLVLNGSIAAEYFFSPDGVTRYISLVLTTFGVMLIQVSFRHYKLKAFIGLEPEPEQLKKAGVLGWIRHPIYAGLILVTAGFFLFIPNLPTLASCACILFYLPIGIALEERKLVGVYGTAYRDYRKEVPSLIPKWSRIMGR